VPWIDAIRIYSYRTTMEHLRIQRFTPLFCEGVNFALSNHTDVRGPSPAPSDRLNLPLS
jgi:hypothetical protein